MNLQRIRCMWLQRGTEQPVLTAYWPRDYPIGSVQKFGWRCYKITRYIRAAGSRFFDVWGRSTTCDKDDPNAEQK
jgi:hypothetical protein